MKKIIIASQNPVKIQATLDGFKSMFPDENFKVKGVSAESGVKDQPMSDEETLRGAENRARKAMKTYQQADYYVGIEGGAQEWNGELTTFAWVVIRSGKKIGKARTATFFLPKKAAELIKNGKELGEAMDKMFNKSNSKQKEGAIGILTGGVIDRKALYTPAIISALIPFKRRDLYK